MAKRGHPEGNKRTLLVEATVKGGVFSHSDDVTALRRDRTTAHYGDVLDWCELLLALLNPALRAGETAAPGLLFDMNRLFEGYVHHLEREAAGEIHEVEAQGPKRHLATCASDPVFRLKPDITIWKKETPGGETLVRIVDAKWKRLDPAATTWNVRESDVYQLLAYATRYDCRHLELVFPQPDGETHTPPVFVIDTGQGPVHIHVRLVRLTASESSPIKAPGEDSLPLPSDAGGPVQPA